MEKLGQFKKVMITTQFLNIIKKNTSKERFAKLDSFILGKIIKNLSSVDIYIDKDFPGGVYDPKENKIIAESSALSHELFHCLRRHNIIVNVKDEIKSCLYTNIGYHEFFTAFFDHSLCDAKKGYFIELDYDICLLISTVLGFDNVFDLFIYKSDTDFVLELLKHLDINSATRLMTLLDAMYLLNSEIVIQTQNDLTISDIEEEKIIGQLQNITKYYAVEIISILDNLVYSEKKEGINTKENFINSVYLLNGSLNENSINGFVYNAFKHTFGEDVFMVSTIDEFMIKSKYWKDSQDKLVLLSNFNVNFEIYKFYKRTNNENAEKLFIELVETVKEILLITICSYYDTKPNEYDDTKFREFCMSFIIGLKSEYNIDIANYYICKVNEIKTDSKNYKVYCL